jgi:hypothetical protein
MAGGAGWTDGCWSPDDDVNRIRVVPTCGPGGGTSTLIEDLASDPLFAGRFVALPEATFTIRTAGLSLDRLLR